MNSIVIMKNNEPVTTSKIISEGVKLDHDSVLKSIRKYEEHLKDFGTFGIEIEKSAGRPTTVYYLNEQQTTFLITLMKNTDVVISFKKSLVKEFYRMKSNLMEVKQRQGNEEWKRIRTEGKKSRREETDVIKEFALYCERNGSKNAHQYYDKLTTMEHSALFILEQKFKGVRNFLNGQQLMVISTADQIVAKALKDGMDEEMEYHAIYQLAKERIIAFSKVIPKTPVIMLDEIKLL